jgi:hypothetical protein
MVPAVGAILALSTALAVACFVRAFGATFLGRARSPDVAQATEADRWSLAAMVALAGLCVFAGILPGFVIDALAAPIQSLIGGRMPAQAATAWLAIAPISESRSSYDGFLVFAFITAAALLTSFAVHRLASHALRRAPAWDCGYPDPSPLTQYSSMSFAQPIRRVFGAVVFRAREHVVMPPPGDASPAVLRIELTDFVWDWLYAPIAHGVGAAAATLNHLQFLTIRRYLSLVFCALVALLLVLALWL